MCSGSLSKSLQVAFIFSGEKERSLAESIRSLKREKLINALHRDSQPRHYRLSEQPNSLLGVGEGCLCIRGCFAASLVSIH